MNEVEIKRWRSKTKFATANYVVRTRKAKAQTMSDGTFWDGWENVGHFKSKAEAKAAAVDAAAN